MKTLFLLATGPSLKQVDLNTLTEKDTFGVNGFFNYVQKENWFPKYYGLLDDRNIRPWSYETINEFIKQSQDNIENFFFYEHEKNDIYNAPNCIFLPNKKPRVWSYNNSMFSDMWEVTRHKAIKELGKEYTEQIKELFEDDFVREKYTVEAVRKHFKKEIITEDDFKVLPPFKAIYLLPLQLDEFFSFGGNASITACKIGICLGYQKIVLLGCDCNYVTSDHLLRSKDNHFCDEYYGKTGIWDATRWNEKFAKSVNFGEHFTQMQLKNWSNFKRAIEVSAPLVKIVNCTPGSKIDIFEKSTLEEQL